MEREQFHYVAAIRSRDIHGVEFFRAGLVSDDFGKNVVPSVSTVLRDIQGGVIGKYVPNTGNSAAAAVQEYRRGLENEIARLTSLLQELDEDSEPLLTYDAIENKVIRR